MIGIFELACHGAEIVECCRIIYWDKREQRKKETVEVIRGEQQEGETTLLSTAIRLCNDIEDQRKILIILWSILDSDNKKSWQT